MNAEHALLGSVLRDNRTYWKASKTVNATDFADPRLGAVWEGVGKDIASGGFASVLTAAERFSAWGVRGLSVTDPHEWDSAAEGISMFAVDYAQTVAREGARRFGKETFTTGLELLADPGNDPEQVLTDVVAQTRERQSPDLSLEAVPLAEVLAMEETYDWVVPGLFERKDRLILTGAEGAGKSTMARQLLLLPAAGLHPFTFEQIDPVRALVIDAENTAKQWKRNAGWVVERARKLGNADPAVNVHLSTSGRVNILDPRTQGQIHRLIDQHKPDMVFLGPLYRIAMKLNTDDDVAPVIAALDAIRDRGVVLVMEAHAGHEKDGGGQRSVRPRGSSALMGWPEFGFGLRASTSDPGVFDFVPWRGAREARDWPVQVRRGDFARYDFPWVVHEGLEGY